MERGGTIQFALFEFHIPLCCCYLHILLALYIEILRTILSLDWMAKLSEEHRYSEYTILCFRRARLLGEVRSRTKTSQEHCILCHQLTALSLGNTPNVNRVCHCPWQITRYLWLAFDLHGKWTASGGIIHRAQQPKSTTKWDGANPACTLPRNP